MVKSAFFKCFTEQLKLRPKKKIELNFLKRFMDQWNNNDVKFSVVKKNMVFVISIRKSTLVEKPPAFHISTSSGTPKYFALEKF